MLVAYQLECHCLNKLWAGLWCIAKTRSAVGAPNGSVSPVMAMFSFHTVCWWKKGDFWTSPSGNIALLGAPYQQWVVNKREETLYVCMYMWVLECTSGKTEADRLFVLHFLPSAETWRGFGESPVCICCAVHTVSFDGVVAHWLLANVSLSLQSS